MSLLCTLSGEIPEQPVVSPVSGTLYEKRLIEKYIEEYGTDPTNRQPLTKEQLVEITTPRVVRPKLPTLAGIPGLLKTLQDEWDALMLYNHSLKQQLQTTRQDVSDFSELSHALYQHDAACRVIARLQKELAAAREALATLKPQVVVTNGISGSYPSAPAPVETLAEPMGIPEEVLEKIQARNNQLTAERKQRGKAVPEGLATVDQIKTYHVVKSIPGLHSASTPGITCLDIQTSDHNQVVTGGNDKMVVVHDRQTEQILASCKGHTGRINKVAFVPHKNVVVSASQDSSFRVWSSENGSSLHAFKTHKDAVTAVSVHPAWDYLLTSSKDTTWALSDISVGRTYRVEPDPDDLGVMAAQFHPDGMILAAGTANGAIRIWDIREGTNVANFLDHTSAVESLCFSENGYHLVSAAADNTLQVWDLRKLKTIKGISMPSGYEVKDLSIDGSASYLAVAGNDLRVYRCKEWSEVAVVQEASQDDRKIRITGARFGQNASFIAVSSLDRTVKYYAE